MSMYTLTYQRPRPAGIFGRLNASGVIATAALLVALGATQMVPWHADESASRGLASLLNNGNVPASMASLMAEPTADQARLAQRTPAEIIDPAKLAADGLSTADAIAKSNAPSLITAAPTAPAAPAAPAVETKTIALNTGQTIAGMLQELGMVGDEAMAAMNAVKNVFDLRRLKAGQQFEIVVRRDGETRNLLGLSFLAEPTKQITLERQDSGKFGADAVKLATETKRVAATAQVRSSLYEAAQTASVPRNVVRDMIKMFSHTVDFQRDIHPGDKFHVYYNQEVTKNGDQVGTGDIVYAAIESAGKMKQLYRYEYAKGQYDFFDENGKSARRSLLRTPIESPRVTSSFGMRRHPILGYSKMHEGMDFGAPTGTPIYAAGDGVIEQIGWFGGYGRYVKIRHNNKVQTAYAHTHRFANGLKPGSRVRQGQVIAYVGTTGRSTGPHLHYEVIMNNRKVNPQGINVDTGKSLSGTQLTSFKRWREKLAAEFVATRDGQPENGKLAFNNKAD